MKKRFLSIFLVIILVVTNVTVSYADRVDENDAIHDLTNINLENAGDALNNNFSGGKNWEDIGTTLGEDSESKGGIMRVILDIIQYIPKMIVKALLLVVQTIVPTMDVIIFNGKDTVSVWNNFCALSYFDTNPGGMARYMVTMVSAFYQVFRYVALIGFVVAIAAIAVKMIVSSIGKQKQQYKEALKNWLIGLVLLIVGHWIMIYSIYFSNYLVDLIYNIKNVLISSSNMLWSENNNTLIKAFSNAVGSAGIYEVFTAIIWALMAIIVIIVFVSMNLKIFKVYLERVIVVGVLIMIFPIVTVFYAFEKSGIKKGATFESWLRTYMDQVFIQPVHAISLVLIMVALNAIAETVIVQIPIIGMIVVLMVLNMMFSIENVIKRVFAINGAALGQPVNPTAPAAAALGIAAPMARHGFNSGQKTFSELKAAKTKGAFGKALKSGMKSGLHFGVIGKNRIRNLEALLGGAGVSLPKGILGREHMSVKEQKDAERLMLKASRNKNLKSIAGNQLWESVKNLKNTTDPDIVAEAFRKLPGFSEMKLRNALLRGEGSADDLLNARKFMAMMADPTVDVSGLDKDEFNYYSNKDDSEINRDLAKGKKITRGTRVSDDVKLARKTYMLRNPDKGDKYMGAVGLDNAKIEAIESGSSTYTDSNGKVQSISANDTLAYELMIRKFGGSDIAIDDCKDTSGYFDSNIVHNIDMSDSEIKHDLKNGKKTTLGRSVDNSTVTARKLYEINNPKVAEKIRIELGLDVEQINAIEAGQSTYTAGGVTHSITADDVLSYKVMMDRYRSGKDMEDYMDSNGDISEIIYEGISMSDRALNTEALDLTQKMPDVINNSADKERARTVLAGLRNRDENELFKAVRSVGKNVNFNDINDFIDGKKVSCDSAAILAVIDEVIKNR